MEIPNHRAGVTVRSGDTHVIDPSVEHAEAVNTDRAPAASEASAEAKPSRRRGITVPADGTMTTLTGDGSGDAADPITSQAE